MDPHAVLAAFDAHIRRHEAPDRHDEVVEREVRVVRIVSAGWAGVTWSDLDSSCVDEVIAAQVDRFARRGRPWEWKNYSYDQPSDLPERLAAAGFAAEPAEALMVAEIADLDLDVPPPSGVEMLPVTDARGVAALVGVHDVVFGGNHVDLSAELLAGLRRKPPTSAAVIASADGVPIGAGRLELRAGTDFASLWGGGTMPAWRGRGVFRSMVAHRGALAAARGFRYLQVDASPDSRPILRRLGFTELAMTTPFVHLG